MIFSFEHVPNVPQTSLMLPEDNLLTQVLYNLKKLSKDTIPIVWSMHDHDSLLRDNDEEQLDDSERREAWIEYEAEKLALNCMY